MRYLTAHYTDKGIQKNINQDSLMVLRGEYKKGEAVMAVVCDGMGGLKNGEVASSEVARLFSKWFQETFEQIKEKDEEEFEDELYESWENLLQYAHRQIRLYGQQNGIKIGTTATVFLLMQENYYFTHVGDCRLYELTENISCLTSDQTLASLGAMDNRNLIEKQRQKETSSILIQGIGASEKIRPIYHSGQIRRKAVYLLCSDGFRHKISEEELLAAFDPVKMDSEKSMEEKAKEITEAVLERGEKDNISVILFKTL